MSQKFGDRKWRTLIGGDTQFRITTNYTNILNGTFYILPQSQILVEKKIMSDIQVFGSTLSING